LHTDLRIRIFYALAHYNVLKFESEKLIETYRIIIDPIINFVLKDCFNETDVQFKLHQGLEQLLNHNRTEYNNDIELPSIDSLYPLAKDLYNIWRTKK